MTQNKLTNKAEKFKRADNTENKRKKQRTIRNEEGRRMDDQLWWGGFLEATGDVVVRDWWPGGWFITIETQHSYIDKLNRWLQEITVAEHLWTEVDKIKYMLAWNLCDYRSGNWVEIIQYVPLSLNSVLTSVLFSSNLQFLPFTSPRPHSDPDHVNWREWERHI